MTEKSRIKQRKTVQDKYGKEHYKWMAEQRWNKPEAKDQIERDDQGRFIKKIKKESADG